MKRILPLTAILLLACLAPVLAQPGKDDAKNIQGTWTAAFFEKDGVKRPPPGQFKLKIGTDKIEAVGQDDPSGYKLGVEGKLGTVDIKPAKGPDKDKTIKGIYELKGDDLRICLPANPENERPKEFTSRDGAGIIYLKRE